MRTHFNSRFNLHFNFSNISFINNNNYNYLRFIIIISLLLINLFALPLAYGKSLDKVIAVVNSNVITQTELNQQINMTAAQLKSEGQVLRSQQALRETALQKLIDDTLQLEIARKAHITISEKQLDDAIAKIAAQNNMSTAQLLKSVASQGIDKNAYRAQLRKEFLIHTVQQKTIVPDITITPGDIEKAQQQKKAVFPKKINFHAHYHIVDIVFKNEQTARKTLLALQENIHRIKNLNDIQILVNKYNSNTIVSDLGDHLLNQFPDLFTGVIKNLQPAEFSAPIKAANGFHLLLLVSTTAPRAASETILTPQQLAYRYKYNQVLKAWLGKLRNQSYIKLL